MVETGLVESLHVFPIKSCRGLQCKEWPVGRTGLEMDRLWCLGRPDSDGPAQYCFVSQREIPKMALIAVSLPGSSPVPGILDRGGMLAVSASWMDRELRLPFGLDIPVPVVSCSIRVWDDTVDGLDQGGASRVILLTLSSYR